MGPTDDYARHFLRAAGRKLGMARDAVDAGERLRHLQDGLALVDEAQRVIARIVVAAAHAVAGVPRAVIPDEVTAVSFPAND